MTTPIIDLRSDTITKPTPAMRRAMAEAEVGDDVFKDDPTVNRLEELAAEMLGKEAALFVSSGTQGNLASIMAHCGRGDEMIAGDISHIFLYEQGGSAVVASVHPRPVKTNPDGTFDLLEVEEAIRSDNPHYPISRMIAVENTHNRCNGRPLPIAYMDAIADLAHKHNLKLHVDGARLWNAAVALGVKPERLVEKADSVTCCLSKGLAAPIGSVLAGSKEFIYRAHRARKLLGGATRQAGVIAAAGIVALTEMVDRLAEDHANAKMLARGLAEMKSISIDPATIETNMVYFDLNHEQLTPADLASGLAARNVLLNPSGGKRLRAVTNYHVTSSDVERVLDAFEDVLQRGTVTSRKVTGAYG